jgi:hypothetical protein
VVAYDDSRKSENSFSLVKGKWSAGDLNGDRDGTPQGEWMIRLKLNPLPTEEQKRVDALGAARFREAAGQKKDFVWGFTDAVHRIFPDRPYVGPLGNEWTLDAARDERESCQLLLIPVATEMRMTAVFVGDFHPFQGGLIRNGPAGVTIPASAVAVRLVRTVLVNKQEWPDPLPQAYRIDIPLGRVQAYWLTVHVPADARPGAYRATVTVASMNTGGRDGRVVKFPLDLRVRDFAVPALSRYQMVVHGQATPAYHLVRGVPSTFLMWVCRQP